MTDLKLHTCINHSIKVCLVVVLIDLTQKMSKLLNLEIFIELVCIDHLIKAISQQPLTGLVCNYTHVITMTWRCVLFWICSIQYKNCQNYTFKLILIWLAFFTISSRLYLQVWSVAVLFVLRKSRKTKHKIFEFFYRTRRFSPSCYGDISQSISPIDLAFNTHINH